MKTTTNSVTLQGRLGAKPEAKNLGDNKSVANARLAVNEGYYDSNNEWVDKTAWFNLVFWDKLANLVTSLEKGELIQVVGRLTNNSYTDKDNKQQTVVEIVVQNVIKVLPIDKSDNTTED